MIGTAGKDDPKSGIAKVNPRSTGVMRSKTYEKHTHQQSLEPEARELARCQQLDIHTKHVFPVRLVDFNERENRLTTARIAGGELFLEIWNPTYLLGRLRGHELRNEATLLDRISELGSWLRVYHESSRHRITAEPDSSWLEAAFRQKIGDLQRGKLIPEQKISKIERSFRTELAKLKQPNCLSDESTFACKLHGDFTIYNIMIDTKGDLHVVDFGDTRVSANIEDLSRFYSSLWAISQTNRVRRRLLIDVLDRFLISYGLTPAIVETPFFRCNLAFNYINHLSGQNYMKHLLSWNSNREMSQVSKAGMQWIYQQF